MNKIADKLVEEFSENIDGNEMIYNKTMNTKLCNSCAIHIELFVIYLIINITISRVFIYFYWYLKKKTIFVLILILILKQQFIRYIYKWRISKK